MAEKISDFDRLKTRVIKTLSHPVRMKITEILQDKELCVYEIEQKLDIPQATCSRHLGILAQVGVLSRHQKGKNVLYKMRMGCINNFLRCLSGIIAEDLRSGEMLATSVDME